MNKDSPLYTVVFTFVVCAFFVFFLALASELTKDRVAANRRFAERSAVLRALGVPVESRDRIDAVYESSVAESEAGGVALYRATVDGAARFAKRFSGSALWGTVTGVLAVDAGVERIAGLEIVSHNETPGLGGRIDEAWFKDQFRGERIGATGIRIRQGSGAGDPDKENGELDAVTGASRTSGAMEKIVNTEIAALRSVRDAGGLK
jgi:Na+-transporting NADH:ubiquinone oxidoreductase subunit C